MDGVVDLVGGEAAAAHRHAASVADVADGSPFDAEPVAEFVHCRARPVVGDQLLDLIGAELPGAAGTVALDRRMLGRSEAGKLLREFFQGPDLVFCVRVRSPNLHDLWPTLLSCFATFAGVGRQLAQAVARLSFDRVQVLPAYGRRVDVEKWDKMDGKNPQEIGRMLRSMGERKANRACTYLIILDVVFGCLVLFVTHTPQEMFGGVLLLVAAAVAVAALAMSSWGRRYLVLWLAVLVTIGAFVVLGAAK